MKEQRADLFLFYHNKRESVERFAAYASLGFLLIAAMSRSVVTKVSTGKPDTWDYLGGGIDNGFLIIFGPVAILVVSVWFNRMFCNCLKLRKSLLSTVLEGKLGDDSLSSLEEMLLAQPFACAPNRSAVLRGFLPRAVFVVGLISSLILLAEYATFRPENSPKLGWLYLLIGEPYLSGFEPEWPRYSDKQMPWIYPPWYTIAYVGILYYLGSLSLRPPLRSDGDSVADDPNTDDDNSAISDESAVD